MQGRDINLDLQRIVGYRQFCNKIWNAFRFAMTYIKEFIPLLGMSRQILYSLDVSKRDQFILSRLNTTTKEVNEAFKSYQFAAATTSLYSFFLYDFCDVYLELIKPVVNDTSEGNYSRRRVTQATLYTVLEQYLRLLHPIMPYVTEELWQRLPNRDHMTIEPSIMLSTYPKFMEEWEDASSEKAMGSIKDCIHTARSLRAQYKIPNHIKANFYYRSESESIQSLLAAQKDDFCTLAKGNCFEPLPASTTTGNAEDIPKGFGICIVSDQISLFIDLTGLIEIDTEIARLTKEIER